MGSGMPGGHEIAMALRGAYWAMHRRADALLQPHGVTANQFVLLCILAERDGPTQQEVVRHASSDANTVRAMLLLLERDGLIARRSHPRDGRARRVMLTERGRQTHAALWTKSRAFHDALVASVGAGETDRFVRTLRALEEQSIVGLEDAAATQTPRGGATESRATRRRSKR